MKKKIFLVYEYREGFAIPYSALAFVEDNNPDGFGLLSSHQSSSLSWAKLDIVNKGHSEIYNTLYPNGYEFVEVGVFQAGHKDEVIAALGKAKGEAK